MKKYLFPLLIALSALSLAGAAAFFSITGLSKLFGGAKMEVIVMASALEFAKLVTASFLHRYWKVIQWQMKTYLTIGVVTVMIITSLGIYGFLSNAYSITANKLQNVDTQVQMVDQKKTIINAEILRLEDNKKLKTERVQSLVTLRSQQEARVDSLYNRKQIAAAKRVEIQIEQSTKEVSVAAIEIDTLNNRIQKKYGEISGLDLEVLDLKSSDVNSEVGPLRYIAKLTGRDMDSVVNFFILLLIFVFDPLAVSLVLAANIAFERELKKKEPLEPELEKPIEELSESNERLIEVEEEPVATEPLVEEIEIKEPENHNKEMTDEEGKEKIAEVVQYFANESGEFKPVDTVQENLRKDVLDQIKSQGIKHNASYLRFLDILFKSGEVTVGTELPKYDKFLEEINAAGISYTEKEIKDFLTICNLFKITDMSDPEKKKFYTIAKDYAVAKEIITLLSN